MVSSGLLWMAVDGVGGGQSSGNKNMKSHKLQINILNAITFGLIALTVFVLLAKNFLTENCNKLNDPNPSSRSNGAQITSDRPAAHYTEISRIVICSRDQKDKSNINAEEGPSNGQQGNGTVDLDLDFAAKSFMGANRSGLGQANANTAISGRLAHRFPANRTKANRAKRFVLFDGGGVVKLVLGTSFPIALPNSRYTLFYFYNFHLQYTPPPVPLYWWSVFNTTTFPTHRAQHTRWRDAMSALASVRDHSREFVYKAIENIFERQGLHGAACLLRAICDAAHAPFLEHAPGRGGLFHALLNAVLTPTRPNVSAEYLNARQAGLAGADCAKTFKDCRLAVNWLERISYFVD